MTQLRNYLATLFTTKKWCRSSQPLFEKDTADIYNGPTHAEWWCVVLAYTDLATAKSVLVQAIQNEAALLSASELKTKMESLTVSMTVQEYTALMDWARPLRQGPSEAALHGALYGAARFLKEERPEIIPVPIHCLIRKEAERSAVSMDEATTTFYTFLRGQVDLNTWKGEYA